MTIYIFTKMRKYHAKARTHIFINKPDKIHFPSTRNEQFIIETDVGNILTHILEDGRIPGLGDWFDIHPNLKQGDELKITVFVNNRRYKLEIV